MPKTVPLGGKNYHFPDQANDQQMFQFLSAKGHNAAEIKEALLKLPQGPPATATTEPAPPEERSLGGFALNAATSTGRVVKEGAQGLAGLALAQDPMTGGYQPPIGLGDDWLPEVRPPATIQALAGLLAGAVQKVIPGEQEQERYVDALIDLYGKRYGSMEQAIETAYSDPAGVLSDVATIAGGTGLMTKLGPLGRFGAVQKTGQALTATSRALDPVQNVVRLGRAAGKAPAMLLPNVPERLMESAIKPSTGGWANTGNQRIAEANRKASIAGSLEEGIPFRKTSPAMAQVVMRHLQNKIDDVIDAGVEAGGEIDIRDILPALDKTRKWAQKQAVPEKLLNAIDDIEVDFLRQHGHLLRDRSLPPRKMTIREAQELKKSLNANWGRAQKALSDPKVAATSSGLEAKVLSLDALRNRLKQEVENFFPDAKIKDWNRRYGQMKAYNDVVERALRRARNTQLSSLGSKVMGGLGFAASEGGAGQRLSGAIVAAALNELLDGPMFKSRLAIALHRGRKRGIKPPGVLASSLTPASRIEVFRRYLAALEQGGPDLVNN